MFRLSAALAFMGVFVSGGWAVPVKAAAPDLATYGKLPGVEQVSLSPSGKRLAMIGVVGDERKLLVGAVGALLDVAANVGSAKARSVEWAGPWGKTTTGRVPFDQSTSMQRALAAANKPVEMVVLTSEDHWLSREATRTQMLTSAMAFIEKYNPSGDAK